ncbi:MAG: sugar ABC transporter ATP-binding protein, partial [Acetobacteraceae bacterium]|nr:sugar ABC transporter ATP-binding protein [Acetobacteraceae bacterium]
MAQEILRMEKVSKHFPGVVALDRVDFELREGEVHALLGANGAGKSTLMKILTGVYPKDAGRIYLRGREVTIDNPRSAISLGINIIHQERTLAGNLTVAQNVMLQKLPRGRGVRRPFVDVGVLHAECRKYLAMLGSAIPPHAVTSQLSAPEQQIVEIAKALAFAAQVIIMDEPTSSLTQGEQSKLFEVVGVLKQRGKSVIYITHRLEEIFHLADRATVLRDGRVVGTVERQEFAFDLFVRMITGRETARGIEYRPTTPGETVLELRGLTTSKLRNVSLRVREREVVGLIGLVGSGRTEVARAIFGLDPRWKAGEMWVRGQKVRSSSPSSALGLGIGLVPEDRKRQGVILRLPLFTNVLLVQLRRLHRLGFHAWRRQRSCYDRAIKRFGIVTTGPRQLVKYLSGGNQQKVVVAKWLLANPGCLILDEPTVGIDVGAKADIHRLIRNLASDGLAILLISSEVEELM